MRTFVRSISSWLLLIAIVVLVITANSTYTIHTLDELAGLERRLFTTNKVINSVNSLHVAVLRAESGQRGYLLTLNDNYLDDYNLTLNQITTLINKVNEIADESQSPTQQERIVTLISLTKLKLNELIKTVELAKVDKVEEALALVRTQKGLNLYDEFETLFIKIEKNERVIQEDHIQSLIKLRTDSVNNLIISAVTTGLLIIGVFFLLRMNIRETIKHRQELQHHNMVLESRVEDRTQELKVFADELSRSNRELEDFAFVASHDLQEPLRKIRAFGNRLSTGYSDVIDSRGQDFLNRMLNAAERMSMLISDLLAFSRVTTRGKEFEETSLNQVVNAVLDDLEIVIEETHATIEVAPLPALMADKSQMNQLFLNLLSNSLKFIKPNQPPSIRITCKDIEPSEIDELQLFGDYDWVEITLQDNGIGFEQSFAEKIFSPFQRLHGRSEYNGTGIGLAVCRRIVERHNGEIKATSELGNGATFTILLPKNGEPFSSVANTLETE